MNPIGKILKQRNKLLESEENLRNRKRKSKRFRNRLTLAYYSFYRSVTTSCLGKSIYGYIRFLFTDLLENIYILGSVLFFRQSSPCRMGALSEIQI